ncbi:unnamed protein product [Phytophthora lilii]|uniref:Unnamed protein product n=1 Tax=Phytophthora lilii TaxID=2077276 RepID=A0A9W6WZ82_9STRA|nr:unnamed protein product [Phytophthora lilii]
MIGIDEDMNPKLSNADNDAKRILTDYYTQLQSKDFEILFRLSLVVETKHGIKIHPTYYFGKPTNSKPLNFMTIDRNKNTQVILKSAHDINRQSSEEYDHDDNLHKLHDDSEAAFQAYGEAQKRYEEAKKKGCEGLKLEISKIMLKAAASAMKATKAVYLAQSKKYNQASHVKTNVEDYSSRQDQRSINAVSGSGVKGRLATPSAYIYRQLGSKYIRIPDLDNETLVIVQPNRRKCGPKRVISDPLQSMIRTLAFKQHIDQSEYDKLSIDDKKLFKEILAITHLQYNFHDQLEDPLDSLRAE